MEDKKFLGIITKDVITATEDDNAFELSRLMKEHQIGAVVITTDDKVVGIVSERDIAWRVVAEELSPREIKARDFMTRDIIAVQLKEGLNKIYQTLCEIDFRHLLIMDDTKLIGITSRRDLLDALSAKKRR